jgi:hypothetical protein
MHMMLRRNCRCFRAHAVDRERQPFEWTETLTTTRQRGLGHGMSAEHDAKYRARNFYLYHVMVTEIALRSIRAGH